MDDPGMMSAWFAGPKAENAPWFQAWIQRIAEDYNAWRRNYFPEDGVVVDSSLRRHHEPFVDAFEDKLMELLARLKGDVPFHSPRYAAHMLAEQTLPGIAGYFAAMLYNPNNVAAEAAPVTVRLELEAGRLLSKMIGYGPGSWAHLCSGGTSANLEALWVARTVRYLPFVLPEMRAAAGLAPESAPPVAPGALSASPRVVMERYAELYAQIAGLPDAGGRAAAASTALSDSAFNVAERGLSQVVSRLGSAPVLLAPQSHHYCFEKALDVLGVGRRGLVGVRVDEHFRMRPDDLERTLDEVERQGRHVLAVVAVVGSTEEGSVDPLDQIVRLRDRREAAGRGSFWLHADGAYGGYLRTITVPDRAGLGAPMTNVRIAGRVRELPITLPEHKECAALEFMSDCDSVTIDPHKLGYIPYPAGAVCFRSDIVKPLMRQVAPYLEDAAPDPARDRTSDAVGLYGLEGSKPGAAAAAVWLSHTLIPLDTSGHGRLIRDNIRNACELHALIEGFPALADARGVRAVCLCQPGSNIVCYAFRPESGGAPLAAINRLNRALYARFSLGPGHRIYEQSFFVSRTSLSPRQYTRDAVGPFLERLGVSPEEYLREGVFLLRSVLMNPWHGYAKRRGRYFLSELVEALYSAAAEIHGAES